MIVYLRGIMLGQLIYAVVDSSNNIWMALILTIATILAITLATILAIALSIT